MINTIDVLVSVFIFGGLMWVNMQKNSGFQIHNCTLSFTEWFMYRFCGYRMSNKMSAVWLTILLFLVYKFSYTGFLIDLVLFFTCRAVWLVHIIEIANMMNSKENK